MYVNTGDGLNMRMLPTTDSQRIRTLPIFTEVIVLERSDTQIEIDGIYSQWVKIKAGNDIGWVFGGYLSENGEELTRLLGDWESESHYYRFRSDGTYSGGKSGTGAMHMGKWTLVSGILYISGLTGDESGLTYFTDRAGIFFIDETHIKIIYQTRSDGEIYTRTVLEWLST
jgi:hypothetical protein